MIKGLNTRVLVREEIYEEKTKSGIVLPEQIVKEGQYAQSEGIILKIGHAAFNDWPESEKPEIGNYVHFRKYQGFGKKFKDKYYRFLHDDEIEFIADQKLSDPDIDFESIL